jgi:hypothetical protein
MSTIGTAAFRAGEVNQNGAPRCIRLQCDSVLERQQSGHVDQGAGRISERNPRRRRDDRAVVVGRATKCTADVPAQCRCPQAVTLRRKERGLGCSMNRRRPHTSLSMMLKESALSMSSAGCSTERWSRPGMSREKNLASCPKFFEDSRNRFGYTRPRYCLLIIGTGGTDNSFTKEDLC